MKKIAMIISFCIASSVSLTVTPMDDRKNQEESKQYIIKEMVECNLMLSKSIKEANAYLRKQNETLANEIRTLHKRTQTLREENNKLKVQLKFKTHGEILKSRGD